MSITIRDLSAHSLFQNELLLVAGFGGIDTPISSVTVIDTPLIPLPSYRLESGVFVLSSFFLYRDNPAKLCEAIRNLVEIGASALCIRTDSFSIQNTPAEVLDFCNQANVPLFQVNEGHISSRKIITSVEEMIHMQEGAGVLFSRALRGNIKSIFNEVVKDSIAVNFVCLTTEYDLIARYSPNPLPSSTDLVTSAKRLLGQKDVLDELNSKGDFIRRDGLYLFPCCVYNTLEAVIVFEYPDALGMIQVKKIHDLANLLSLQIMETILLERGRRSATLDQMNSFLLSEYPDEETARAKFEVLGFPTQGNYRLVLIEHAASRGGMSYYTSIKIEDIITQRMEQMFPKCIGFNINSHLVILVPIPENSKYMSNQAFARALGTLIEPSASFPVYTIRYTCVQQQFAHISVIYNHLLLVSKADKFNEQTEELNITLVNDFDSVSLILPLISSKQHWLLYDAVIKPIQEYDRRYHSGIWETMVECMKTERLETAAANLHVHPSTLRYRLQKVEALTGYNFFSLKDKVVLYAACLLQATE